MKYIEDSNDCKEKYSRFGKRNEFFADDLHPKRYITTTEIIVIT